MRRMELALGAMGAEMTGTNRAMGTLVEGLLLFGGGSATVIAVLGGLAAVAGAIKLLSIEGATSQRQMEELEKQLDKLGAHGKLMAEQMKLDALKAAQTAIQADPRGEFGIGAIVDQWKTLLGTGTDLQTEIIAQEEKVRLAATEYNKKLDERLDKLNDARLSEEAFVERITQELARESATVDKLEEKKALVDGLNEAYAKTLEITQGPVQAGIFRSVSGAGGVDIGAIDKEAARALEGINRELDKDARESERQANEWGKHIAVALVDGITGKLNALVSVLKSALEAFLGNAISGALSGLFGGGGGGGGASFGVDAGAGAAVAGAKVGNLPPMGLTLNVNTANLPAPLTPFDAARDAMWQAVLRESSLVAYQGGFRTPGQT